VREIEARRDQPELVFTEIATSESFAPHPPEIESETASQTQYLVG
jgi:hypothetical protein